MNLASLLGLTALGSVAGYLSGLVGIGGGIIIVPALVLIFKFDQQTAQGTTLALLLPPIGALAVYAYYQKGFVDMKTAAVLCVGFLAGSYLGSKTTLAMPEDILKKIFAVVMVLVGIRMWFTAK